MSKRTIKVADLRDTISRLGTSAGDSLNNVGGQMQDWWKNLNPEARSAIVRGLSGAAVGGGLTGTLAALTPSNPEEHKTKNVMRSALIGSLMGGVGAAGFPVAEKMFGGEIKFKGEPGKDVTSKVIDPVLGVPLHHPFATAGTAAGATVFGRHTLPRLRELYPDKGLIDIMRDWKTSLPLAGERASELAAQEAKAGKRLVDAARLSQRAGSLAKFGPLAIPAGFVMGSVLDKYLKGNI